MRALAVAFAFAFAFAALSCARSECAAPNARVVGGCAECEGDRVVLLGACVTRATADAYCGRGARFLRGRCEGVSGDDADGDDVEAVSCPRGTTPRDGGGASLTCVAGTRCRAGEIAEGPRCAPLFREAGVVDLGAFLRGAIGVDGGEGTADVCAPLRAHPRDLPERVAITVALRFPANQVADLNVRVLVTNATSGERIASREASIESSILPLADVLRALGGRSSAAAADVTVTCAMPMRAAPSRVKSVHP